MPRTAKRTKDMKKRKNREYQPTKPSAEYCKAYELRNGENAVSLDGVDKFEYPTIALYIIDAISALGRRLPTVLKDYFFVCSKDMKVYSIHVLNTISFGAFKHYLT